MEGEGTGTGRLPSGRQHVHHSYIWLGGIRIAVQIVLALGIAGFSLIAGVLSESGELSPGIAFFVAFAAVAVLAVAAAIVIGYQWWSWRHLCYEIGADEFTLSSGIFNKKRVHVPYQRVQSVDVNASLLQRAFGVCTASIDTAGGAANKAILVPYLQRSAADQLRAELFARKRQVLEGRAASSGAPAPAVSAGAALSSAPTPAASAAAAPAPTPAASAAAAPVPAPAPAPASAAAVDGSPTAILDAPANLWGDIPSPFAGEGYVDAAASYEYGLSNKELVLAGLSNATAFGVIVLAVIGAFVHLATWVVPVVFAIEGGALGSAAVPSALRIGVGLAAVAVKALVIVVLVTWGLSILGTCLSFGGFRARRRARRIEVERGLLQHRASSVDIDRVQSVVIKQSFIRRIIGYCELSLGKIDAAEGGDDARQQSLASSGVVVHPFVKADRVPEILQGLAPEFADIPVELTPLPKAALLRAVIRRAVVQGSGFWLAVAVTAVVALLWFIVSNPVFAMGELGLSFDASLVVFAYMVRIAIAGYAFCAVLFLLDVVRAVLWYRRSGFAYNDRFMRVLNGGFSCDSVSFPRRKIQFGCVRTNPLQRRAGTATVLARTAAGIGGTTTKLVDVRADDADAWLSWLEPRPQREG